MKRYYEIDVTEAVRQIAQNGCTVTGATLRIPIPRGGRADEAWQAYLSHALANLADGEVLHDVPRLENAFKTAYVAALIDGAGA